MAELPTNSNIEVPSDRPAPASKRSGSLGFVFGVLLSLSAHVLFLLLLIFFLSREDEIGSGGGMGWADEIEITASRESSSGLEGDPGSTAEEMTQQRQSLDVSIVYAPPPPPPEPEEYLPDEEEEIEPEEIVEEELEPEPEEVIEEALIEDEVEEEDLSDDVSPEGLRTVVEREALIETSATGDGGGEGGLSDTLAGSPIGTDGEGLGTGNADAGRPGAYIPGGELRDLLSGWTLRGVNGFSDGSTGASTDNRNEIPWNIYYAPNGQLTARYRRYGAPPGRPRATRGINWYQRGGSWTIEGDVLCQRIERWGAGGTTCFEVHRDGDFIAMYYEYCRGVSRCWEGRLGPRGRMLIGRHLRD